MQFHWDPDQYLALMRSEVPEYDRLQSELVAATAGRTANAILDLGTGTGETARRVLGEHPDAHLVGIDSGEAMLARARENLPEDRVELSLRRLEDPLPDGPFDLVVSALAVHHLHDPQKLDLFTRARSVLRADGRFVLADCVRPETPSDAVTPIDPDYDFPSSVDDQLAWLARAGFSPRVAWSHRDLAVLVADRSG